MPRPEEADQNLVLQHSKLDQVAESKIAWEPIAERTISENREIINKNENKIIKRTRNTITRINYTEQRGSEVTDMAEKGVDKERRVESWWERSKGRPRSNQVDMPRPEEADQNLVLQHSKLDQVAESKIAEGTISENKEVINKNKNKMVERTSNAITGINYTEQKGKEVTNMAGKGVNKERRVENWWERSKEKPKPNQVDVSRPEEADQNLVLQHSKLDQVAENKIAWEPIAERTISEKKEIMNKNKNSEGLRKHKQSLSGMHFSHHLIPTAISQLFFLKI